MIVSCLLKGVPRWRNDKESAADAGDAGDTDLIPRLGRSPGEGNGKPLQCFCLENSMNRGAWRLQSIGSQELDMTECAHAHIHTRAHTRTRLLNNSVNVEFMCTKHEGRS